MEKGRFNLKGVAMWIGRLGLVFTFLLPTFLQAQAPKYTWSNLSQLRPGQKIQVVEKQMKELTCEFVSFTDEAIVIRRGKDVESVERSKVERVSIRDTSHRTRHMILGAAIGGGVALAIGIPGYVATSNEGNGCGPCAIGIAAGFGGGTALGALPSYRTIYRAHE